MAEDYDLIVIGGGPAGYAGAIRAAQLGKRTLCVERDKLGGICLNWGCIPTKALLSNAHLVETLQLHGKDFGWNGKSSWDFAQMIKRSRNVTVKMNQGIQSLFKKYKVDHQQGEARVIKPGTVKLGDKTLKAPAIIIATGARPRPLPGADFDGKTILSYKEAMNLPSQPQSLLIVGAGAIGCEFGYFYHAVGTKVTIVEMMDRILPIEDDEISAALEKSFAKRGLKVLTKTKTGKVEKTAKGVRVELETPAGKETIDAEKMLVSIGVTGNVEEVLDPSLGVELVKGHIKADPKKGYVTNVPGLYAVGDVIGPPWLAHVAHHEAINCVETLCGKSRPPSRLHVHSRLHLHRARSRQPRPHRASRPRSRSRNPYRSLPVPRQRPRCRRR